MNQHNIQTGLSVNKDTAIKMASEVFFLNKRVTAVNLRTYNKLIVLSYKGKRSNELDIRKHISIVRVVNLTNKEAC